MFIYKRTQPGVRCMNWWACLDSNQGPRDSRDRNVSAPRGLSLHPRVV